MDYRHVLYALSQVNMPLVLAEHIRERVLLESADAQQLLEFLRSVSSQFAEFAQNFESRCLEIDRDWQIEAGMGVKRYFWGDSEYPQSFSKLADPPLSFAILGTPWWLTKKMLGVVGSREASQVSYDWMANHLREFMSSVDCGIVSGGARGIDQAAHEIALMTKRPTLIVLPSGLRRIYPASLVENFPMWLDQGATLVSEYPLFSEMRKHHFHHRNRLISGFAELLLVVEARRKSGSIMSAGIAAQQGTPVAIVPAHPSMVGMLGNLDLWLDGALPVRDAQDLIMYLESEKIF